MKWLFIAVMLLTASAVMDKFKIGYDDTDDFAVGERSGLFLYTDHLTGCQYIATLFGGPTPRLDAQNHQICKKE